MMIHNFIINPSRFLGDIALVYVLMEMLGMSANTKCPGLSQMQIV